MTREALASSVPSMPQAAYTRLRRTGDVVYVCRVQRIFINNKTFVYVIRPTCNGCPSYSMTTMLLRVSSSCGVGTSTVSSCCARNPSTCCRSVAGPANAMAAEIYQNFRFKSFRTDSKICQDRERRAGVSVSLTGASSPGFKPKTPKPNNTTQQHRLRLTPVRVQHTRWVADLTRTKD